METKDLLRKIVNINSVFPNEIKLAIFLENYLKEIGFSAKRQEVSKERFNVLGQKGHGKKCVLFYGHMDTVQVCQGWSSEPFSRNRK